MKFNTRNETWAVALVIGVWAMLCVSAPGASRDIEDTEVLAPRESPAWFGIARTVIPRVLVEADGEYAFKMPSGGDGVRRVTIGTDHLAAIRRFWRDVPHRSPKSSWPVLQTTLEWDPASGTYTLTRVELGFFRRRVWLIHQLPDAEDRFGSIGIQIKKEW